MLNNIKADYDNKAKSDNVLIEFLNILEVACLDLKATKKKQEKAKREEKKKILKQEKEKLKVAQAAKQKKEEALEASQ